MSTKAINELYHSPYYEIVINKLSNINYFKIYLMTDLHKTRKNVQAEIIADKLSATNSAKISRQ